LLDEGVVQSSQAICSFIMHGKNESQRTAATT